MKVTPYSEKEIQELNIWPEGIYDFEVYKAEEALSKNGNEMLVVKTKVINNEGRYIFVDDYLIDDPRFAYKLRNLADATGLLHDYEAGSISEADLPGKAGKLKLIIQKDKTGQYSDRNVIKDYIKKASTNLAAPIDDEIPF